MYILFFSWRSMEIEKHFYTSFLCASRYVVGYKLVGAAHISLFWISTKGYKKNVLCQL